MRKVLFRVLIIILLFLLFVLGAAFYKNKTPLALLKGRFGVEQTVVVTPNESEKKKQTDTTEQMKSIVTHETGAMHTGSTTSSGLSEKDIQDTKNLIDSLIQAQ